MRRARGFTILEMLVVLVIVGMITTTLMQALSQIYRLQDRFGVQLSASQQGAMLADWFRQVVQGLQPDQKSVTPENNHEFKGSTARFSGLTTMPLSASYGAAVPVEVELAYDNGTDQTTLRYHAEGGAVSTLMSWEGRGGRFRYIDTKGERHESWPPPLSDVPQLPQLIELQAQRDGAPWLIVAAPRGPSKPLSTGPTFGETTQ